MNRFISQRQPVGDEVYNELPSPLEVNRFIPNLMNNVVLSGRLLPSPLEVNRFIPNLMNNVVLSGRLLPSPREVNRFISVFQEVAK